MTNTGTDQSEELKPCPFCGSPGEIERSFRVVGDYWACCTNQETCGVFLEPHPTQEAAVAAWNRRVESKR